MRRLILHLPPAAAAGRDEGFGAGAERGRHPVRAQPGVLADAPVVEDRDLLPRVGVALVGHPVRVLVVGEPAGRVRPVAERLDRRGAAPAQRELRRHRELLAQHSDGLLVLSGCLNSEVSRQLSAGDEAKALQTAGWYQEVFGKDYYFMEVQSHGLEQQIAVTEGTVKIARAIGAPLCGTNDSHYLEAEHSRAHEALLCIQTGTTMSDPNRWKFSSNEFYVKSADEMRAVFKDLPEAYRNTLAVAERCNVDLQFGQFHLPNYQVPEGYTRIDLGNATLLPGLIDMHVHMVGNGVNGSGAWLRPWFRPTWNCTSMSSTSTRRRKRMKTREFADALHFGDIENPNSNVSRLLREPERRAVHAGQRLDHAVRDRAIALPVRMKAVGRQAVRPPGEEVEHGHGGDVGITDRDFGDQVVPGEHERFAHLRVAAAAREGLVEAQHADRRGRIRRPESAQDRTQVVRQARPRGRDARQRLGGCAGARDRVRQVVPADREKDHVRRRRQEAHVGALDQAAKVGRLRPGDREVHGLHRTPLSESVRHVGGVAAAGGVAGAVRKRVSEDEHDPLSRGLRRGVSRRRRWRRSEWGARTSAKGQPESGRENESGYESDGRGNPPEPETGRERHGRMIRSDGGPDLEPTIVLAAENLTKRFGKREVVSDVSFEIVAGEVFGFLGPNGAGKTTTIRMLVGLARPDHGRVRIAGFDVAHDFAKAMAEQNWMVITGAGPGIMEAGIEGAGAANSFGVSIRLPREDVQLLTKDAP